MLWGVVVTAKFESIKKITCMCKWQIFIGARIFAIWHRLKIKFIILRMSGAIKLNKYIEPVCCYVGDVECY